MVHFLALVLVSGASALMRRRWQATSLFAVFLLLQRQIVQGVAQTGIK